MRFCSSCGHELGVGRFCTNCGQPVTGPPATPRNPAAPPPAGPLVRPPVTADALVTTEERRAARRDAALTPGPPRIPPAAADTPVPPRFPLFADEVGPDFGARLAAANDKVASGDTGDTDAPGETAYDLPPVAPGAAGPHDDPTFDDTGGSLLGFGRHAAPVREKTPEEALAALNAAADSGETGYYTDHAEDGDGRRRWPWLVVVLAVVAVVAGLLIWSGLGGDGDDGGDADQAVDPDTSSTQSGPTDLTEGVKVKTPGNAGPSKEVDGDEATFVAANMLDGVPGTAWRVPGDATGKEIVFTFPAPVTITEVGLVNGYAKVAEGAGGKRFDWYHGNRTIAKVAWVFDDDTLVPQTLKRNRSMQTIPVDGITTSTLTLRILQVSKPGTGRAARDFTAISDVTLAGTSAG